MKFEKLGIEVADKVTLMTGIITARASYITGCDQYLVQPRGDGSKYPEPSWIDEGRLDATNSGIIITPCSVRSNDNGCDISAPIK